MTTPLHQYLQAHAAPAHGHQAAMHALRAGKLEATWLWHTFPRLQGTGPETDTPALSNRYEAEDYLNHPLLGHHLREAAQALLRFKPASLEHYPALAGQLRSSLTLFDSLARGEIFGKALKHLYRGTPCPDTQQYMDETDLERFVNAQESGGSFTRALCELTHGRKRSHWMWYIFPVPREFAHSDMAFTYGLSTPEEARRYVTHPLLGMRLQEASRALLQHEGVSISQIMGTTDAAKLRTCMTVFHALTPRPVFAEVLRVFFDSTPCTRAEEWLHQSR